MFFEKLMRAAYLFFGTINPSRVFLVFISVIYISQELFGYSIIPGSIPLEALWIIIILSATEFFQVLAKRTRLISLAALISLRWLLSAKRLQSFSIGLKSEASRILTNDILNAAVGIIVLVGIGAVGYWQQNTIFYEFRNYALGGAATIILYKLALALRIIQGYYGMNEYEAVEFYEWLKQKSSSGDDDFGGKAVEDAKNEFLAELGYDVATTRSKA